MQVNTIQIMLSFKQAKEDRDKMAWFEPMNLQTTGMLAN
jgi:hypothetical protein